MLAKAACGAEIPSVTQLKQHESGKELWVALCNVCMVFGTNSTQRIIQGSTVSAHVPYMLQLLSDGGFACGAPLLDAEWGVTAAHCVEDALSSSSPVSSIYSVKAGVINIDDAGTTITVYAIYMNPCYTADGTGNNIGCDIAMLHFSNPFTFTDEIQPIPLATTQPTGGSTLRITGWGEQDPQRATATDLQEVTVPVLDLATFDAYVTSLAQAGSSDFSSCLPGTDGVDTFDLSLVCATGSIESDGTVGDACQGDSGGPLARQSSTSSVGWELVALVSFGYGCGRSGWPAINTNTVGNLPWIQSIMSNPPTSTLCNGRTCAAGAECSNGACVCKAGYSSPPGTSSNFGATCRLWLNNGVAQTVGSSSVLYELVPTNAAWSTQIIHEYIISVSIGNKYADNGLRKTFNCGFVWVPQDQAESTNVVSQALATAQAAGLSAPSQIWTALRNVDGTWYHYLAASAIYQALASTTALFVGSSTSGNCGAAVLSATGSANAGQLQEATPTTEQWYIIRYVATGTQMIYGVATTSTPTITLGSPNPSPASPSAGSTGTGTGSAFSSPTSTASTLTLSSMAAIPVWVFMVLQATL